MEEVTRWSAKVSGTHMWLLMTFYLDHDSKLGLTNRSFDDTGVGMSPELEAFVNTCSGEVGVDKKEFALLFSNKEDFVRFKLLGVED